MIDLDAWSLALRAAGWEALSSPVLGEVAARRERGGRTDTLVIDHAGRFKFVASRRVGSEAWSSFSQEGRAYDVVTEQRRAATITGVLDPRTTVELLLADLDLLSVSPPLEDD